MHNLSSSGNRKHTLMATTLGELAASIGAFGKNWISPSSLASNWKITSSCPTLVKLNLDPSKGCSTLSTLNSVGLFLRWRPSFSWAIKPWFPGITYTQQNKQMNWVLKGWYYQLDSIHFVYNTISFKLIRLQYKETYVIHHYTHFVKKKKYLGLAGSDIIAKKSLLHPILPLPIKN